MRMHFICLASATFGLSACSTTTFEKHYFAHYDEATSKPVNFYRMTINGSSKMSRSRYIAGYYDERAVDLFFNEVKTLTGTEEVNRENIAPIFVDGQINPGTTDKLIPLTPTSGNGAFVLVMSNNADSVVNAIGAFAESEVLAQSLSALLMKDRYKERLASDASASINASNATALKTNLQNLITAAGTATNADAEALYLSALNALARDLGHDESFADFTAARTWFAVEQEVANGQK